MSRPSASIGPRLGGGRPQEVRALTPTTPDALWEAPALRLIRPAAISCSDISHGRLLDRCSLTVPVGMRLLLVAEPAASGSALLRVLAGLSRPRRGRMEIAGITDRLSDAFGRRVAYVGPEPGIHPWLTPREALALAARLLRIDASDTPQRIESALSWAGIPAAAADRPVGRGGPPLLQRAGLAAAILSEPDVLLFDEPLRAIEARERQVMLHLPGARRSMILASRYPTSEAGLATHVGLLRRGRVALVAPIADLDAAGLPLSLRGIGELADRRVRGPEREGDPRVVPAGP